MEIGRLPNLSLRDISKSFQVNNSKRKHPEYVKSKPKKTTVQLGSFFSSKDSNKLLQIFWKHKKLDREQNVINNF